MTLITKNPEYNVEDFLLEQPQFEKIIDKGLAQKKYDSAVIEADEDVNIGLFKSKWKKAMSFYIAHELTLWGRKREQDYSLNKIAHSENKGFDGQQNYDKIMATKTTAYYWNMTTYGQQFYNLRRTLSVAVPFITI